MMNASVLKKASPFWGFFSVQPYSSSEVLRRQKSGHHHI
jgi:hypothetical protein